MYGAGLSAFPYHLLFCCGLCLNIGKNSDKIAFSAKLCGGGLPGKLVKRADTSKGRRFFACAL